MGRIKELIHAKAEEIALREYSLYYGELSPALQEKIWKLAEQAAQDFLASSADAERERRKYE